MLLLGGLVFALHALLSRAQTGTNSSSSLSDVVTAFNDAKIVPDIIPTFNPRAGLSPVFMGSSGPVQVFPGISLNMNDTQTPPQYLLTSNTTDLSTSNASWVIAIVDPDVPSPQNLHFLGQDFVVDPNLVVQGGGLTNASGLMNMSQALAEFIAPNPPPGSPHRYVVLVYLQPSDFNVTAPAFFNSTNSTGIVRQGFSISNFATNTSLGDPIAGTFFLLGSANTSTSTTTMMSSSTTPMTQSSTPLPSTLTPAPVPSSPSPPPPQNPATTSANVPSAGEKVTSCVSLFITMTFSVAIMLV